MSWQPAGHVVNNHALPIQSNPFTVVEPWELRFRFLRLSAPLQHPVHSPAPAAYIYRAAFAGFPGCPQGKFSLINRVIEHMVQSPPARVCPAEFTPQGEVEGRVPYCHLDVAPSLQRLLVAECC